ncbi:glycosyl transferase [Thalassospira marina]|uniref:Glycosyl transferase n=2 Tax=Thalassospira marina TaxID=2048283 RepID=A0ABN5FMK6_9PROT|nr:glycosyl transferase [Thalassospira marina]
MCVHNEEERLAACLEHLRFADELVILCDKCTDSSEQIARDFGAKVVVGRWDIEGERRNQAQREASGDWLLEIDADEHVSAELAHSIRAIIANPEFDRYPVYIDNYIGKRLVKYGWGASFGTSIVCRLLKPGTKQWGMQRVHPSITWSGREGPVLKGSVAHYLDRNISDMVRRLDSYSTARAKDLKASGNIGTLANNIRRFFSRFIKCFIGRKGYREGALGLLIAIFAGLFPLISYIKAKYDDI